MGAHSIAARGSKFDTSTSQLSVGAWSSTAFTLVESTNLAPVVTELSLLSDSGIRGDGATENTTLVGQIIGEGLLDAVAIEVDLDNDGTPDQTVFTDAEGRFRIDPKRVDLGSVTIATRAVRFDAESANNLYGTWSSISFTYEDQPDEPPKLFDFDFDPGSTASGVDPSLSGTVTSQQDVKGIRIEIDTDGDGIADHTATTNESGQFDVDLAELADGAANVSVRATSIQPETKQLLAGDWETVSVDYVVPPVEPASMSEMSLVNDSGSSDLDAITSDPTVRGVVNQPPAGRVMIVEFDVDGDSVVDGSTIVSADLTWSYNPTGLDEGPVTISARTRDTLANGEVIEGEWSSMSFTLESSIDPNASPEEQTHQGELKDAVDQSRNDQNVADTTYSNAVDAANAEQNASVDAADTQYRQDVALADADFVQAEQVAAANYQVALANFSGDTTSFVFEPITWPDAVRIHPLQIPADSEQGGLRRGQALCSVLSWGRLVGVRWFSAHARSPIGNRYASSSTNPVCWCKLPHCYSR